MNRISLALCLILFCVTISAYPQCDNISGQMLNANNIRTTFHAGGTSFQSTDRDVDWRKAGGLYPSYLPNRPNPITLGAGGLWIGAKLAGETEARVAASGYAQNYGSSDYTPGPIDPNTGHTWYPNEECEPMNQVWKVYGREIEILKADFDDNGRIDQAIPENIKGWPSRGNPFFEAIYGFELADIPLASFFDRNNNRQYEPQLGEYPIIGRDMMDVVPTELLWTVYNDDRIHEESQGEPLQVEVQMTAWAFQCQETEVLNSTFFARYRVKNYNPETLYDMRVGLWHNNRMGCYYDNYFGCDTLLNTTYYYNGDEKDGDDGYCLGTPSTYIFSEDIPVQAFTILNQEMYAVPYYYTGGLCDVAPALYSPTCYDWQFYNFLDGLWRTGEERTVFGIGYLDSDIPTRFSFFDNPNDENGWSQYSLGLYTGGGSCNYHAATSIAIDSLPNGRFTNLDVAYSVHQKVGWSHIENVNLVEEEVPQIQAFYDSKFERLCEPIPNCEEDCVWPGDANHDGVVDGMDLFPIGVAMGEGNTQGTARPLVNVAWQPFGVENWSSTFLDIANHKHADCNGDGMIDSKDVIIVQHNFGQTWDADLFDSLPAKDSNIHVEISFRDMPIGRWERLRANINLSSVQDEIYGFSLQFGFESQFFKQNISPLWRTFSDVFDNEDTALKNTTVDFENALMNFSLCRTDGQEVAGEGRVGYFFLSLNGNFTTNRPDSILEFDIIPKRLVAINSQGELLKIHAEKATITIENVPYVPDSLTSIIETEEVLLFDAAISPNPSNGYFQIQSNQPIQLLEIFDMQGRVKMKQPSPKANLELPREWSAGLYFVRLTDKEGRQLIRRLLVQ